MAFDSHRLNSIPLDVQTQIFLPEPSEVRSIPCHFTYHHISAEMIHHLQATNIAFYDILEPYKFGSALTAASQLGFNVCKNL